MSRKSALALYRVGLSTRTDFPTSMHTTSCYLGQSRYHNRLNRMQAVLGLIENNRCR
jgi:hypothetical protein